MNKYKIQFKNRFHVVMCDYIHYNSIQNAYTFWNNNDNQPVLTVPSLNVLFIELKGEE